MEAAAHSCTVAGPESLFQRSPSLSDSKSRLPPAKSTSSMTERNNSASIRSRNSCSTG